MPSASSRKLVQSHASGRHVIAHFQQLTGVSSGPGFADGGTWTDVPGLSNVPVIFRTMMPYERVMAQQLIYRIQDVGNYDENNTDIILYLEEWQPTGTVR